MRFIGAWESLDGWTSYGSNGCLVMARIRSTASSAGHISSVPAISGRPDQRIILVTQEQHATELPLAGLPTGVGDRERFRGELGEKTGNTDGRLNRRGAGFGGGVLVLPMAVGVDVV